MRLPPKGRERSRRHWSKKGGLGVGRFMVEVDGGRLRGHGSYLWFSPALSKPQIFKKILATPRGTQHFSSPLQWKHGVLAAGLTGKSLSTSYVDLLRTGPGKWTVCTLQPLLLYHCCFAWILPSFLYFLAFEILFKVLLSFQANKPLPSFLFFSSFFFFGCLGYAHTFSYFPSYAYYDLSCLFIFMSVSLDVSSSGQSQVLFLFWPSTRSVTSTPCCSNGCVWNQGINDDRCSGWPGGLGHHLWYTGGGQACVHIGVGMTKATCG